MLFNSLSFLIFFPIVTAVFFLLPHRFRWFWLLAASCFFYMFFIPVYILILFITIVIDYIAGLMIEKSSGRTRKAYLIFSIISTCLVLFIFKYFNFFIGNIDSLAALFHWNYSITALKIILPIGLSFHTFQSLSYVIEVYRGKFKAERHFGIYSLYVMFYPQLVAGPIERPQNMLPQFHEENHINYGQVVAGLRQMLLGFFKKVFIADRLAILVTGVYANPTGFHGLPLILATVFFAFQIYCDFSGYSDIAIGSAKVMGFKLMDNFNRPYFSASIGEFWKRWHISLSSWFRDYIYIPLGGNRVPRLQWIINILVTFLISGFWHGASWTFVIWGGLHGLYLVFWDLISNWGSILSKKIGFNAKFNFNSLGVVITFILVCFAWIFFRASSFSDSLYIVTNLFSGISGQFAHVGNFLVGTEGYSALLSGLWPGASQIDLIIAIITLGGFVWFEAKYKFWQSVFHKYVLFRWFIYYFTIVLILFFGVFDNSQFIYFQF